MFVSHFLLQIIPVNSPNKQLESDSLAHLERETVGGGPMANNRAWPACYMLTPCVNTPLTHQEQ